MTNGWRPLPSSHCEQGGRKIYKNSVLTIQNFHYVPMLGGSISRIPALNTSLHVLVTINSKYGIVHNPRVNLGRQVG